MVGQQNFQEVGLTALAIAGVLGLHSARISVARPVNSEGLGEPVKFDERDVPFTPLETSGLQSGLLYGWGVEIDRLTGGLRLLFSAKRDMN